MRKVKKCHVPHQRLTKSSLTLCLTSIYLSLRVCLLEKKVGKPFAKAEKGSKGVQDQVSKPASAVQFPLCHFLVVMCISSHDEHTQSHRRFLRSEKYVNFILVQHETFFVSSSLPTVLVFLCHHSTTVAVVVQQYQLKGFLILSRPKSEKEEDRISIGKS